MIQKLVQVNVMMQVLNKYLHNLRLMIHLGSDKTVHCYQTLYFCCILPFLADEILFSAPLGSLKSAVPTFDIFGLNILCLQDSFPIVLFHPETDYEQNSEIFLICIRNIKYTFFNSEKSYIFTQICKDKLSPILLNYFFFF